MNNFKILVFDTECNSLDTKDGVVMELAWALYEAHSKRLLRCSSQLIKWSRPYQVDPEAFDATRLSRDFCESHGDIPINLQNFVIDLDSADAICGHNAHDYDRPMLLSNLKRVFHTEVTPLKEKLLIDTMFDCPYSKPKSLTLKYLALDHGHILNDAHQAMADVFACAHVLFSYSLDDILKRANTPICTISVKPDWGDKSLREKLLKLKFRWSSENKVWEKRTRAFYAYEIKEALGRDIFINGSLFNPAHDNYDSFLPF